MESRHRRRIKDGYTRRALIVPAVALTIVALAWAIVHDRRQRRIDALLRADPDTVQTHPDLERTALAIGAPAFSRYCASCHGPDAAGDPRQAAPDLRDDDHLYGMGRAGEIEQIVLYGIRSTHSKGRNLASMPAYAREHPYRSEPIPSLTPAEIRDVTEFVRLLAGNAIDRGAAARGATLYGGKAGCYDCHGADGRGDPAIGAPNLTDDVWLYGDGSAPSIAASISYGRAGTCPAFVHRISPLDARAIAVYVATLAPVRGGSPLP